MACFHGWGRSYNLTTQRPFLTTLLGGDLEVPSIGDDDGAIEVEENEDEDGDLEKSSLENRFRDQFFFIA
jgi:hypothetical protein